MNSCDISFIISGLGTILSGGMVAFLFPGPGFWPRFYRANRTWSLPGDENGELSSVPVPEGHVPPMVVYLRASVPSLHACSCNFYCCVIACGPLTLRTRMTQPRFPCTKELRVLGHHTIATYLMSDLTLFKTEASLLSHPMWLVTDLWRRIPQNDN